VTPTTSDPTATVKVNGKVVTSGKASGSIALAVGKNIITTVVTAQNGTSTDTYTVTVTRASGPLKSLDMPVSVTKPADNLAIENDGVMVRQGVSPNGDGINDVLTIDGITAYPVNRIAIIDRNGAVIFEAKGYNNISKVFDGHSSVNGRMQQPGTYFYSLDYVADGQSKHKTGYIILKY
jgi:gliding motility-associated-like protein